MNKHFLANVQKLTDLVGCLCVTESIKMEVVSQYVESTISTTQYRNPVVVYVCVLFLKFLFLLNLL